jgi:quinol monooxygenase YgiN
MKGGIKMIYIVARGKVKPGAEDGFKAAVSPLVEETRKEEGNISYGLFEDTKNPGAFAFIEQWRDDAAIAKHNASPHFTSIIPTLGQYLDGPLEASFYKESI